MGRQLENLKHQFLQEGGFTERLYRVRMKTRDARGDSPSHQADSSAQSDPLPVCPRCQKPMVLRTARKGPSAGKPFWGCSAYPDCTGTRPANESTGAKMPP
ncbi:MAG: hypothetical protein FJ011_01505 [Chloroflexi bacterium]|nr:hypothetical protein [Chloroflexota bacterium]